MTKFKKGQKVKLTSNRTVLSPNMLNEVGTVVDGHINGGKGNETMYVNFLDFGGNYTVYISDLTPLEVTVVELTEQKQQLQSDINAIDTKLAYLSEVGKDVFDEIEYKVYQTLKALDDASLSLADKTKLITGLLNH